LGIFHNEDSVIRSRNNDIIHVGAKNQPLIVSLT
jgi:hypothetical protein